MKLENFYKFSIPMEALRLTLVLTPLLAFLFSFFYFNRNNWEGLGALISESLIVHTMHLGWGMLFFISFHKLLAVQKWSKCLVVFTTLGYAITVAADMSALAAYSSSLRILGATLLANITLVILTFRFSDCDEDEYWFGVAKRYLGGHQPVRFNGEPCSAELVNISTSGAKVKLNPDDDTRIREHTSLTMILDGHLALKGQLVSLDQDTVGINFYSLDRPQKQALDEFLKKI